MPSAGRNLHTMMAALQSALLTAPLCYVAWAVAAGFAWTPTPASLLLALGCVLLGLPGNERFLWVACGTVSPGPQELPRGTFPAI